METNKHFSINLRRLRDSKGWSQQELATEAEVGLQTIFRAESKNIIPRGKNIEKIARALGVPQASLFSANATEKLSAESVPIEVGKAELALTILTRVPTLDHAQLVLTLEYIDDLIASAPEADLLSQNRLVK